MTTTNTLTAKPRSADVFELPDPPPREPDEMTSYDHLHAPGSSHYLIQHFGNPETTLVFAERFIVREPRSSAATRRNPDLAIAFGVDPAAYYRSNGYIVSEQGKPPDFVLEVASKSTAHTDVGAKRDDYAAMGIPEYWRFDETGEYHGARLAGERMVSGRYEPISIERLEDDVLQGYSEVLDLNIRWESGRLRWYDPATERHITTFEDERARADREREARLQAEARVRQLEDLLGRQDS